jgi:hypothetical protein
MNLSYNNEKFLYNGRQISLNYNKLGINTFCELVRNRFPNWTVESIKKSLDNHNGNKNAYVFGIFKEYRVLCLMSNHKHESNYQLLIASEEGANTYIENINLSTGQYVTLKAFDSSLCTDVLECFRLIAPNDNTIVNFTITNDQTKKDDFISINVPDDDFDDYLDDYLDDDLFNGFNKLIIT